MAIKNGLFILFIFLISVSPTLACDKHGSGEGSMFLSVLRQMATPKDNRVVKGKAPASKEEKETQEKKAKAWKKLIEQYHQKKMQKNVK